MRNWRVFRLIEDGERTARKAGSLKLREVKLFGKSINPGGVDYDSQDLNPLSIAPGVDSVGEPHKARGRQGGDRNVRAGEVTQGMYPVPYSKTQGAGAPSQRGVSRTAASYLTSRAVSTSARRRTKARQVSGQRC